MPALARGERSLELDGREYPILFTNRALMEVEDALKTPIIKLLSSFEDNALSITQTGRVLTIGLEAARRDRREGRKQTFEDALYLMDRVGFTKVTTTVYEAIADVLSFGDSEESEEAEGDRPT